MISPSLYPFERTVAGSTPFLYAQDFPGKVFKPVHPCEKEFYELLQQRNSPLKKLVPKYYGTLSLKPAESCKLKDGHTPSEYLVLEDLTHDFTHPCILDVKLGVTHHDVNWEDPNTRSSASILKSKYITTPALGFCLTGMQVFKVTTSNYEFMDKMEGRDLTEHTISDKLHYFFYNGVQLREDIVSLLLQRLQLISMYFENEPDFLFRSTSLLLIYEGHPDQDPRVDARMIDFAHAKIITPTRKNKDEYGYLFGTKNLIRILESFINPLNT